MHFSFFGAAPDTGNLGVSALCYATMHNFLREDPATTFTVFDHGRGSSEQQVNLGEEENMHFQRQGAMLSRRYYRPENFRVMQFAGKFGGLGNPGIKTIRRSTAVLDISGGDSFTDLYGSRRFKSVVLPKQIAIQQNIPLVLLPQTYGPFADNFNEKIASEIVQKAKCAWARDARSFEVLKGLLGSSFDPQRHQCGVDVAFSLPVVKPDNLPESLESLFRDKKNIIGFNVSGLIYNDFVKSKKQFGFKADYKKAILELVNRFLDQTDCTVLLIPHVVTAKGHYESDTDACHHVLGQLEIEKRSRVIIVPEYRNPCEIKWVISKLHWFCGTRMHATIAALSTGVPVSAISYSPKTLGVFEACGLGDNVADPQVLDDKELTEVLWRTWQTKTEACAELLQKLSSIQSLVSEQTQLIMKKLIF